MPNSYTAVPNVIPGNLTVAGVLTVQGEQIKIGTGGNLMHVGRDAGGRAFVGSNFDPPSNGRDVGGVAALGLFLDAATGKHGMRRYNSAGTVREHGIQETLGLMDATVNHTGTTTEDQIFAFTIPANVVQAKNIIQLMLDMQGVAQGGIATVVRVYFGGIVSKTFNVTATTNYWCEVLVKNDATNTSNRYQGIHIPDGVAPVVGSGILNADFSVDSICKITVQSGANTDQQNFFRAWVSSIALFTPS